MIIHSTFKILAVVAGMLAFGGVWLWSTPSPGNEIGEQAKNAPNVFEAPAEKNPTNVDDKTDVKNKEEREPKDDERKAKDAAGHRGRPTPYWQPEPKDDEQKAKDDAAKAEAEFEKAKAQLKKQFKGTWKVVYSDGELPQIALPNGGKLQKPVFYLIGEDHLIWDNGNPNDLARLVRFHAGYGGSPVGEIGISQEKTFPQTDAVCGKFAFFGERLRIRWGVADCPRSVSTQLFLEKPSYSVVLQRANANDPQAVAKEKAAAAPELQSLQGRWRITKVVGAQDYYTEVGHDFHFQGDRLKILWRDTDDIMRPFGPVLLPAGSSPKQIIYFNDDAHSTYSGVYRLQKDRLEICWRIDDRLRNQHEKQGNQGEVPDKFEVRKDSKTIQLIQLERVNAAAEQTTAEKTRLVDLQKARIAALQERIKGLYARFQVGKDDPFTILDALDNLAEAQLALAADKKSRVQILESYVQRVLEVESLQKAQFADGKATAAEVAQARAKRLMVEIILEKEKGR